jgi:hypothetical protein
VSYLVCFVLPAPQTAFRVAGRADNQSDQRRRASLRQPRRHPFYLIQCIIAIHVGDKTCQKHSPESSATTLWWLTRSEMSTRWPVRNQFPRRAILLITGLTECVQSERESELAEPGVYVPRWMRMCCVRPWLLNFPLHVALAPNPKATRNTYAARALNADIEKTRALPLAPLSPASKFFETLPLLFSAQD